MDEITKKIDTLLASVQDLHTKVDAMNGSQARATTPAVIISSSNKGITLPELARRLTLENGQQRVAAIIGYYEKLQGKDEIVITDIQQGWKAGKFPGAYAAVYLHRALKDALVRQKDKGAYDLTQTGEDFFSNLFETSK